MSGVLSTGAAFRNAVSGHSRMAGFSLLELAIGLILLGLVMLPILELYKISMKSLALSDTRSAQNQTVLAVNQFYENGNLRYPCPASLVVPVGDPAHGEEAACAGTTPPPCASAGWRASGGAGICRTTGPGGTVVIGAVPFAALGIHEDMSLDFWDNRILYAVTQDQTNAATFAAAPGAVSLFTVDRNPATSTDPDDLDGVPDLFSDAAGDFDDVDFVLVSTGRTGAGGFTVGGTEISSCPAGTRETQNCDMDTVFLHDRDPDDSRVGARSDVAGPMFFDDILAFQRSVPEDTWFPTPAGLSHVITGADHVGIGTTDPQYALEVNGAVRVEQGLQSDTICDESAGCSVSFDPALITDDMPQMQCDFSGSLHGDQPVMRLAGSQVHCASAVDMVGAPIAGDAIRLPSAFAAVDCTTTGMVANGFDATGQVICVTP